MSISVLAVWLALFNVVSTNLIHDKRVINGEEAEPLSHPYIVSIQYGHEGNEWVHICGGTVIDRNWVLTAAHCVEYRNGSAFPKNAMRLKFGEHNLENDTRWEFSRNVQQVIKHYHWCRCAIANDIALIRLDTSVTLGGHVKATKLSDNDSDFDNENCVVAGWGAHGIGADHSDRKQSMVLREVGITHIPNDVCASKMNQLIKENYPPDLVDFYDLQLGVKETNICFVDKFPGPEGQGSSCHGDSGGPILCGEDHSIQVGIVSKGLLSCQGPDIYTRVSKYTKWIRDTINENDSDSEEECAEEGSAEY